MNKNIKAYLQLGFGMFLAGSSIVIGKLIIASFPVFLASGMRFLVSLIVLIPIVLLKERNVLRRVSKRDWFIISLQAFFGVFLFSILLLNGLKLTGGVESGIILGTTPAVIGIISFIFLKETLSLNKVAGVIFVVLGIIIINLTESLTQTKEIYSLIGSLLIFGAVISEALFTILSKFLSQVVSPLLITTASSFYGFLLFLPLAIKEALMFDFTVITIMEWAYVFYYGIFVTVISFILWFQGVSKVSGSTAGVFTAIMPVTAVILSYIILNELYSSIHLIGMLFVLIAIGLIVRSSD